MLKKVVALRAHLEGTGAKKKMFDTVKAMQNVNSRVISFVNGRMISEEFKARLKSFIQMRNADEVASWVPYEYS